MALPSPFRALHHRRQAQLKAVTTIARPFCLNCPKNSGCHCGESGDATFDWDFSNSQITRSVILEEGNRSLRFHPSYSVGTAACRGFTPLQSGFHHFWELRITSPMYGTDVMVGIATAEANIFNFESEFVSALGLDDKSWGFSYNGTLHHAGGEARSYATYRWGEGTIIGMHLDRWRGTMEFYLNRKPLGVAFTDIPSHIEIYPVITSTAAKSGMRLTCAQSYRSDLAFECVRAISKFRSSDGGLPFCPILKGDTMLAKTKSLLENLPPGLAKFVDNNCWYLLGTRMEYLKESGKPFRERSLCSDSAATASWTLISTDDEEEEAEASNVAEEGESEEEVTLKNSGYPSLKKSAKLSVAGSSRGPLASRSSACGDSTSTPIASAAILKEMSDVDAVMSRDIDSDDDENLFSEVSTELALRANSTLDGINKSVLAAMCEPRDAEHSETGSHGFSRKKRFVMSKSKNMSQDH